MIELLYATGLRVSELVGVRAADLHLDEQLPDLHRQGRARSGSCRSASRRPTGSARYQRDGAAGAAEGPRVAAAVRQRARRRRSAASASGRSSSSTARSARPAAHAQPARAAAFVRDAPARARRRPARHPDDARPRRPVDDADLHARARGAAARGLRSLPPAGRDSARLNRFPARIILSFTLTKEHGMSRNGRHLFTSESVTEGHPDKIADQISDSILDAILAQDPVSRVACETLVTTGLAIVAGEITTSAYVDFQEVVRATINEVGYTRGKFGFDARDLRGPLVDSQPVARHRDGRRHRRRRRPGLDVRLRLHRNRRADAAADHAGAQARQGPVVRCAATARSTTSAPTASRRSRSSTTATSRSASTPSSSPASTARSSPTRRCARTSPRRSSTRSSPRT